MKKRKVAILLALMLLAGCGTQAPAPPPAADTPDMESIIQQSVDEAVQEKMKEYEEEQRKKDEEINRLKEQLEELTSQPEVPPEDTETEPPAQESQSEAVSSQAEVPSQPETVPSQPEPEPPPQSTLAPKKAASSSGQGFDLKSMYPDYVWENLEEAEEESYTAGFLLEEAEETIRLANLEREAHGLDPLPVDDDLMELAKIRAMEIREKYSHTRPDGTSVVDLRCGENCGQRSSASEQVSSWMNSEGHRTNILLDCYHHIGAGCYQAENGNLYWVMVFSLD